LPIGTQNHIMASPMSISLKSVKMAMSLESTNNDIMSQPPPKTNKPQPQPPLEPIPNHPLAAIAGKFEGEFWEETLAEIQRARKADRQYWQEIIETQQDAS
jgi:hypothetical protein